MVLLTSQDRFVDETSNSTICLLSVPSPDSKMRGKTGGMRGRNCISRLSCGALSAPAGSSPAAQPLALASMCSQPTEIFCPQFVPASPKKGRAAIQHYTGPEPIALLAPEGGRAPMGQTFLFSNCTARFSEKSKIGSARGALVPRKESDPAIFVVQKSLHS